MKIIINNKLKKHIVIAFKYNTGDVITINDCVAIVNNTGNNLVGEDYIEMNKEFYDIAIKGVLLNDVIKSVMTNDRDSISTVIKFFIPDSVKIELAVGIHTLHTVNVRGNVTEADVRDYFQINVPFEKQFIRLPLKAKQKFGHFTVTSIDPGKYGYIIQDTVININTSTDNFTSFNNIGGLDKEISEIKSILETSESDLDSVGIERPSGILLYGPPGTGKTMLARTISEQMSYKFILINGPEILSCFVGGSEKNIRNKFEEARRHSPSILFIDEIDSITPKRNSSSPSYETTMVTQLLTEMDGMKSSDKVFLMGATNNRDNIDPAILRPGRLGKHIYIGPPNEEGVFQLLKIYTARMKLKNDVDLKEIAKLLPGKTGAYIKEYCAAVGLKALTDVPMVNGVRNIPKSIFIKVIENMGGNNNIDSTHTFDKIAGLDKEIKELRTILETPDEVNRKLGIEPITGVILYGPPGTGKTMIGRTIASQMKYSFHIINGSELESKWVGGTAENLRNIFEKAKNDAPSIIFFDELDALAPARSDNIDHHSKKNVNQLLTLMDGVCKNNAKVLYIGATNDLNSIDPAVRRPGRFGRELYIGPPDYEGLVDLLKLYTKDMSLEDNFDFDTIAKLINGYTGSDVKQLCSLVGTDYLKSTETPDMSKKFTSADFITVIQKTKPSSMRDIHDVESNVKWDDIIGLNDVKAAINKVFDQKYIDFCKRMKIKRPKGILLYGPPGNGKTMIAKAAANHYKMNFYYRNASEFISKYIGESEKNILKLFETARKNKPSIIFLDEIDSIGKKRGLFETHNDNIVNQLLTCLDGLGSDNDGVFVLAATNRKDILDDALIRPGRFDKSIIVPNPDENIRRMLITKSIKFDNDDDIDIAVNLMNGMSCAQINSHIEDAAKILYDDVINNNVEYIITFNHLLKTFEVN